MPVWGTVLPDPLAIEDSVGRHPADYLMARMPLPRRRSFQAPGMPPRLDIRHHPAFPRAVPGRGAGCIRVTHPSATALAPRGEPGPFDLHVLGLPLAFILSQDQTLPSTYTNRHNKKRPLYSKIYT